MCECVSVRACERVSVRACEEQLPGIANDKEVGEFLLIFIWAHKSMNN